MPLLNLFARASLERRELSVVRSDEQRMLLSGSFGKESVHGAHARSRATGVGLHLQNRSVVLTSVSLGGAVALSIALVLVGEVELDWSVGVVA